MLRVVAVLWLVTVSSSVFRGYNHVNKFNTMFRETYNKYHGHHGIERLVKRASKGEMQERLRNFKQTVEVVNDVNDDKTLPYTSCLNFVSVMTDQECRPGQKCKKWDGNDDDKEEEEEEEDFDVGEPVKCGKIKHFGGRCVDLSNSGNEAVLTDIGCDREFCLTDKGYIKDKVTDKCLTTSDPDRNDNLITFGICKTARTWAETKKGFKIQHSSGKCWHPLGGSANPPNENKIVIYSGCDEDRLTFRIEASMCWEEQSGKKLSKKVGGKLKKLRKLDVAKDMCVETEGCTGIYFTKGRYYLSSSDKPQSSSEKLLSSKKKGDKVFVMTDCSEACQAGEQRCEDGKCREKCEKNDDDCPPGTTRCPDGVCKHVHMC
ncbi:hypothetical protein ACHWQZ_G010296 [Mnemiopsis leidyi]